MIRASFGKTAARSTLICGLALLALPAIAGCEAGLNAPTLEFHDASSGATTVFNGISISDAFVLGAPSGSSVPAGSSASLFVGLFNNKPANDKLVGVSAPDVASSVTIKGGTVTIPAQGAANLTGPQPDVVLKGLTKPLTDGEIIDVTFDFADAGAVKLEVPVEPRSFQWATYSPPAPAPGATAAATARATPGTSAKATPTATASATPTASPTASPAK